MHATVVLRLGLATGVLLGLGCGSDSTGPGKIHLDVAPSAVQLVRNDSVQLRVNALDSDNHLVTGIAVSFESNDTTIVTVTNLGMVHAGAQLGQTVVRVRGAGVFTDVPVLVAPTPATIIVTPADTTLLANSTAQYRAVALDVTGDTIRGASVHWTTLDPTIVTIAGNGLATATSKGGQTFIRATFGPTSGTAHITVLDSVIVGRTTVPDAAYGAAIAGNVAYVTQSGSARILRADLPSRQFGSSVTVGAIPTEIAFDGAGTRAYVTNQYSNSVSVVSVATNTVIDTIAVDTRPFEVIVAPGDSILYVAHVGSVWGIRLSTKDTVVTFAIPDAGNGVAIAHDTLLYVSTHSGGTVIEFNLRTRTLGRTFTVGGTPQKLAVSPDGNELYIANEAGYVQFWNLTTGVQIGSNLELPSAAYGLARRSSNGLLYVTSAYFGGGYLFVVNPVSRTLVRSAVLGGSTRHVVFNADGSIGIVPNEAGWVDFLR